MMVEISEELKQVLRDLSDDTNITIEQIVDVAVWDFIVSIRYTTSVRTANTKADNE